MTFGKSLDHILGGCHRDAKDLEPVQRSGIGFDMYVVLCLFSTK